MRSLPSSISSFNRLKNFNFLLGILCFMSFSVQLHAQENIDSAKQNTSSENVVFNAGVMNPFFTKLHALKSKPGKVSILQLGDSHMQMGYFVGEMRRNFGNEFGFSSLGLIFPHPIAGYRPFYVKAEVTKGQWTGGNNLRPEIAMKYGVSGFTIRTKYKHAQFNIRPNKLESEIMTGKEVVVYFQANDSSKFSLQGIQWSSDSAQPSTNIDPVSVSDVTVFSGWKKQIFVFAQPVSSLTISVDQNRDSLPFDIYGIQFLNPDQPGIIYHNAGVGGSTFMSLCKNSSLAAAQIQDLNPDLIIYAYGSNEAYTPTFNTVDYKQNISNHLDQIKKLLPETVILLTTPPDTRSKDRYPRNIDTIRRVYLQLATEKNLSYWDLRDQMGGNGSLHKWFKLGLASKDKLHFTKPGYELQAKLLTEAIFKAYNEIYPNDQSLRLPVYQTDFK
jgi:lysophospholipase L1-like esterase